MFGLQVMQFSLKRYGRNYFTLIIVHMCFMINCIRLFWVYYLFIRTILWFTIVMQLGTLKSTQYT